MDDLSAIVSTLTKEEQKEFTRFIQRNRFKNARIDLKLYNLILNQDSLIATDYFEQLYAGEGNRNAYHTIRKRLAKHLNDFIYLKMLEHDESLEAELNRFISLIRHLFSHQLNKQAWKYIRKAEKLAKKSELNLQLQLVYELQIEHFDSSQIKISLSDLVSLRQEALRLASEEQNLKIIGSYVQQELKKVKLKGEELDLEKILNLLLNSFNMQDSLFRRPKLRYNFVLIARQIILSNKAFYAFEDYVINNFQKIEATGYFVGKKSQKLNMLYIISHTLYRNKKFDEAIVYLKQMGWLLDHVNKGVFNRFKVKYNLLWAACENFNGNLTESIAILKELSSFQFLQKEDALNAELNLSVYYFQQGNLKMANATLIDMGHTIKWFDKNMGLEWSIKRGLIDVIYQYELGNVEIALDRIGSLEKSYDTILNQSKYQRVVVFLRLIKFMINSPHLIRSKLFKNKVENSFEWIDRAQEDLQAMSYYAWLKSKMEGLNFYEVMRMLILK